MDFKLGEEIKYLRHTRGMSQKELAMGICHQSEISRIESGKVYPHIDVLHQIALKLRVDFQRLLPYSKERYDYVDETLQYLEQLTRRLQYKELLEITTSELKLIQNKQESYYSCFLKWKNTVANSEVGELSYEDSITNLTNLLKSSQVELFRDFLDMRIMNSIATIHCQNGHLEKGIEIYETILNYTIDAEQFTMLKIKVINNYTKSLYYLKRYKESITLIRKGIAICEEKNSIELLGHLYLRLAQSQENLQPEINIKEIAINYSKAIFILNMLQLTEVTEKLKSEKHEYLQMLTIQDVLGNTILNS